jgi:hypothetical protein
MKSCSEVILGDHDTIFFLKQVFQTFEVDTKLEPFNVEP